jgi:DNA end-binding protein Ku
MARSIWTGAIGFGLVHVPVRLYSATEDKTVHFHQLQEGTGKRIRNERVTDDGDVVPYDDIVRGYEVKKGEYVTLTDEELEAAEPARSRTIDIDAFVDLHEIDPIYFRKAYYLFPDERSDGAKPFVLLRRALEDAALVAVGRFVMRDKEYLVTLRPYEGVLALETMFFPDEVREPGQVADPPKNVRVNERELDMAARLVESMTTKWDPSQFHDTHRERVLDIVHRKAKGEEIVAEEQPAADTNVVDLMDVLRASLENASKVRRTRGASHARAATAKKHASKSTARKRPAKKKTAAKRRKAS